MATIEQLEANIQANEATIKKLTEQNEGFAKEIDTLKKTPA